MDPETPENETQKGGGRTTLIVVGALGAIAVFIAAFVLSAAAITAVAQAAGISKTIAWAMVPSVDGLMLTGTVVFISNKLRGQSVTYPLLVLAAGVGLSIVCNALHAQAGGGHIVKLAAGAKMGISAIPALSLALSFHLIADMVRDHLGAPAAEQAPAYVAEVAPETVPALVQETGSENRYGRFGEPVRGTKETGSENRPETGSENRSGTGSQNRQETEETGSPNRPKSAPRGRRKTVVVVDRDELIRSLNAKHIEEHGRGISADKLVEQVRANGHRLGKVTALQILTDLNGRALAAVK